MNKSNDYNIHYINEDGFTYLCLADASLSKATAFQFLAEVKELFCEKFSENVRRQAISYGMYNQFVEYLKTKLNYYNKNPEYYLFYRWNQITVNQSYYTSFIYKLYQYPRRIIKKITQKLLILSISVKATQVRKDPESRALKIKLFIAAIIVAMFLVIYLLY